MVSGGDVVWVLGHVEIVATFRIMGGVEVFSNCVDEYGVQYIMVFNAENLVGAFGVGVL